MELRRAHTAELQLEVDFCHIAFQFHESGGLTVYHHVTELKAHIYGREGYLRKHERQPFRSCQSFSRFASYLRELGNRVTVVNVVISC